MDLAVFLIVLTAVLAIGVLLGRWSARAEHHRQNPSASDARRVVVRSGRSTLPAPQERVAELVSEGIVVFNELFRPVYANSAARRLLDVTDASRPFAIADEVLSIARRAQTSGEAVVDVVELWTPERTSLQVDAVPLPQDEGLVVRLSDISEVQAVLRARRQFVAHASHELKTPVASIRALGEALEQALVNDPVGAARLSSRLVLETERLGKLVRDLLDLSRLEDPATFTDKIVDVSALASAEGAAMEGVAAHQGIALRTSIDREVHARGDEQQIGLMIRNLLDNAVRYTEESGHVSLVLRNEDDHVVIEVEDDGVGIPLRDQARVFERFYRVDEARAREHGGTGLGLAIVKHVAELHGGRVELSSQFGEGSRFTVRLPASDAP